DLRRGPAHALGGGRDGGVVDGRLFSPLFREDSRSHRGARAALPVPGPAPTSPRRASGVVSGSPWSVVRCPNGLRTADCGYSIQLVPIPFPHVHDVVLRL